MLQLPFPLLLLCFLASCQALYHSSQHIEGCRLSPEGIENPDTPAMDNSVIELHCDMGTEFDYCIVDHVDPMGTNEIVCTVVSGDERTCVADNRITVTASSSSCGIRISNPVPDDTGKWMLVVGNSTIGQWTATKVIELFTFNESIPILLEKRTEEEIPSESEIWYNYDEEAGDWIPGTNGWQRVDLECNAQYGRPVPNILWTINRDLHHELHSENIFKVHDGYGTIHDYWEYIRDWVSELSFDVDTQFLDYLALNHGIDTNPESGEIIFDLDCHVDQEDYASERVGVTVVVRRIYNPSGTKGANSTEFFL